MTKRKKTTISVLTLSFLLTVVSVSFAQKALLSRAINDSISWQKRQVTEPHVHYSNEILNKNFDFQLQTVSEGKFAINFFNNNKEAISIKVYDIIGNVLYEDNIRLKGSTSQQIDLSRLNTSFFIVEIKNGQFNKVKSIVAS